MQPAELGVTFSELTAPKEEPDSSPWYLNLSSHIRTQLLTDQLKAPTTPELSQIGSIGELFDHASEMAEMMWEDTMSEHMDTAFSQYSPRSHAGREFLASLTDKDALFKDLSNNRNWQFESLRKQGDPEIWYGLVLALSEREQLKARLLEEWTAAMTIDDEARFGMSKLELQIYAGLNLGLQPNIDQIYVKQMRIADSGMPWSKNPPEYAQKSGSSSLYIIQEGGIEKRYSFQEVFPLEISNMEKTLAKYADHIVNGIAQGKLGPSYAELPKYLQQLSESLSVGKRSNPDEDTVSSDFSDIYSSSKDNEAMCAELALGGCPIIVNPWGFVGEAGDREDMEMLVGLMLGDKSRWHQDGQNLSKVTADFLAFRGLPVESLVPILHQKFLSVNGSNITYTSLASAGGFINFNDGRHIEVGRDRHARYGDFVKNSMSEEKFIEAIALGTMTHELGHLVMYLETDLYAKLGASIHVNKLEELKADTVGTILYRELLKRGQTTITPSEYIEQFLLNYLDDILDAPSPMQDKSPYWYAFDIKSMMVHLIDANAVKFVDGQFEVLDGEAGVNALADLGTTILDLYNDPSSGPEQIETFVVDLEHRAAHNPDIKLFLLKLDSLHR